MDCIFCRIIKKEIPADIIYENEKVIAFMDIDPISEGHSLIVPKEHSENILGDGEDSVVEIISVARKLAPKIVKAVGADGFNLSTNVGSAAGQVVMHTHLHIIPRFKGDGLSNWPNKGLSKEEISNIKNRIVSFLKE